jgi:uncharacterized protein YceK
MRKLLALICVIIIIGMSGCLGVVSNEAPEPHVDQNTLESTQYNFVDSDELIYNQSLIITKIQAKSHLRTYEKINNNTNTTIPLPNSRYTVLSSPSISPFGTELNPIVSDPTDRTFKKVERKIEDSITLNEQIDTINDTHSTGVNITIEKYKGKIEVNNVSAQFDAIILSSVINKDDSVLVTIAAYPVATAEEQQKDIINLIKNTDTRIE